jgi:hypothetical protein
MIIVPTGGSDVNMVLWFHNASIPEFLNLVREIWVGWVEPDPKCWVSCLNLTYEIQAFITIQIQGGETQGFG